MRGMASSSAQSTCSASIVAWSMAFFRSGRFSVATTRSSNRSTRRGPSVPDGSGPRRHQTRSTMRAVPWPTPTHMVASP